MPKRRNESGFSLMELLSVVAVMGVLFAMGVPAYQSWANSNALRGASQMVAGELQNLRTRAMATGQPQTVHFNYGYGSAGDFHIHNGAIGASWKLPKGIRYAHSGNLPLQVTRDGRFSTSAYLILKDRKDNRDTVSVQLSGLVLVR